MVGELTSWLKKWSWTIEHKSLLLAEDIIGEIFDQSIDGTLKSPHSTNGLTLLIEHNEQFSRSSRTSIDEFGGL